MTKKHLVPSTLIALAAMTAASFSAQAADREGLYAFGGVGATVPKGELSAEGASFERSDIVTSFQVGAGYRWNRHLAMEVEAHSTLGKADLQGLGKVGSYGARTGVLGILPLGDRFELVGKVSLGNERSRWTEGSIKPYRVTMNQWNLGLGMGARYWFNDATALRLDLDGLTHGSYRAGPSRGELNIGSVTLGLQHRF